MSSSLLHGYNFYLPANDIEVSLLLPGYEGNLCKFIGLPQQLYMK